MDETTAHDGSAIPPPGYAGNHAGALKELEPRQLEVLDLQLAEHARLNELPLHSTLRDALWSGQVNIPCGTLIHGTGIDDIESIAAHGVMSGELFGKAEDAETHYCADFFRVPEDTTLPAYSELISGFEPDTGAIKRGRMEKSYIPNTGTSDRGIGVIVDARIPELQTLLSADAYRQGTDELFEGIINRLPVDKSSDKAERLSAILGGVPATAIAGIIMDERVLATPGALERVQAAFNGQLPVINVYGELQTTPLPQMSQS